MGALPSTLPDKYEGDKPTGQTLVDCSVLLWRLQFERRFLRALAMMVGLAVLIPCLMSGLYELKPPDQLGRVLRGIEARFALDDADAVTDLDGVYAFAAAFAAREGAARPGASAYWCEKRYFSITWDTDRNIPVRKCESPRLNALGATTMPVWSEDLNWQSSAHVCDDDEAALRLATNQPTATCTAAPVTTCSQRLTAVHCKKTCGYCSPFEYEQMKTFSEGQVALTHAVIHQTRRVHKPCEGFAASYGRLAKVRMAGGVSGRPAKGEELLTCSEGLPASGSAILDDMSNFAVHAACPPCEPGSKCEVRRRPCESRGSVAITPRQVFRDLPVFPELLVEPTLDITRLRSIGWIDSLTESVTVSALVYTQSLEIFSYVGVEFKLDVGGGVRAQTFIRSHREIPNWPGEYTHLILRFILAVVVSFGGFAFVATSLAGDTEISTHNAVWRILEAAGFFTALVYIVVFVVWWAQLPWLVDACKTLLKQVVMTASGAVSDRPVGADMEVIKAFFMAAEDLFRVSAWQYGLKIGGYFVCHLLAAQCVYYLGVHPKTRLVVDVAKRVMGEALHAGAVFAVLFVLLAGTAHWIFGPYVEDYGTLSASLSTQLRWLVGESIVDPATEGRLYGVRLVFYKIYAVAFLLLAFWTMLFVFLAVVLDVLSGKWRPKGMGDNKVVANGFFREDELEGPCTSSLYKDFKQSLQPLFVPWPTHSTVIQVLQAIKPGPMGLVLPIDDLRRRMPETLVQGETTLEAYLATYDMRCSGALLSHGGWWGLAAGGSTLLPREAAAICDEAADAIASQASTTGAFSNQGEAQRPKQDEDLPFVDIPSFDMATQVELRQRVENMTLRWLQMAQIAKPDWWELASTMACSLVQEMLYVLLQADKAKRTGAGKGDTKSSFHAAESAAAADSSGFAQPPTEYDSDESNISDESC